MLHRFDTGLRPLLPVAAFVALAYVAVIANPGFFSHDEWQMHDGVQTQGLLSFIETFGAVRAGAEFGTPVRPIGFVQAGIATLAMDRFPFLAHGFSVLLHVVTTVLFGAVVRRAGGAARFSAAAALLFGVSPLVVFATAWTAACFDQWYAFFAVCAGGCVVIAVERGLRPWVIAGLVAASAGAILSKETAMVLPGALAALMAWLGLRRTGRIPWGPAAAAACASAVPVAVYLAVRWPALMATLHQSGVAYSPSVRNAPLNLMGYAAFPFLPWAIEGSGLAILPAWQIGAALGLHLVLLAAVAWRAGWLAAAAYVAGYVVFLGPVLTLPTLASHYLYGSGFAMALGLAALLPRVGV